MTRAVVLRRDEGDGERRRGVKDQSTNTGTDSTLCVCVYLPTMIDLIAIIMYMYSSVC